MQNVLSVETMWEAIVSSNPDYDGFFVYAVKTTMIFCRPSCKSRIPNVENVTYFFNSEDSQRAGYRPCKRCRPDLLKEYNTYTFILEDTIRFIEDHYNHDLSLNKIAKKVGVSPFHLHRLFKGKTGCTPRSFLERIRVDKAKKLLLTTKLNSTEIGYYIGFQSISSFYNAFKRNTGVSPNQYRSLYAANSGHMEDNDDK